MIWTKDKISAFWAMKDQGYSLNEIAEELGCTQNAVATKQNELKHGRKSRAERRIETMTEIKAPTEAPTVTTVTPTETPTATTVTPTETISNDHFADDGKMVREKILDTAKSIITGEREKQYGHPEDNFKIIAEFWKTYLENRCVSSNGSVALYAEDVAVMMVFLKIARIMSGNYKEDSFVDACGYLAIAGEIMR